DWSPFVLARVQLKNMLIPASLFRRLVKTVIQSGHEVNCTLEDCELEHEEDLTQLQAEMENQPAIQMVAPKPNSACFKKVFDLSISAMSERTFRCLVSMMIESRHSGRCNLRNCTITPKEDVRNVPEETENQATIQMVASQTASPDYLTFIYLNDVAMSERTFRCIVSMMVESRHSGKCTLRNCTLTPEEDVRNVLVETENQATIHMAEEDVRPMQEEMENQHALQAVAPQKTEPCYETFIKSHCVTMPAKVVRNLVSMLIQSGHAGRHEIHYCKIEPEEDYDQLQTEMENRAAFWLTQQPVANDYATKACSVEEEKDVSQLMDEMENEPVLQVFDELPTAPDYVKCIKILFSTLSASVVNCLNNMVRTSKHHVDWKLLDCIIEPREDVRQLLMEMEDNSAIKVSSYIGENGKWNITLNENVYRWAEDRRPVSSNKEK
ncbi:hypothetical protein MAR_007201, partial [Mya arenaria]